MTLKGQQNHYNVKLLTGYGLSVKLKDNKIVLTDGYNPFTDTQQKEEWFITQLPYEKLVISGKGYLSTEAIKLLNQNYKNVILTDSFGHPISMMNGCMESMTATQYRMGQYDTFRNLEKRNYLSNQILKAKIESQIRFLKMNGVVINLTTKEASSSRIYFREFSKLIPKKFGFESRNQSGLKITKRKASDVINALLNYGYAVLGGEISKFLCGIGLDPYFGFLHKQHSGYQPLVYDMMEPFRWLVDATVCHVANTIDSRHCIRVKDYAWTKDGQVVLSSELKRKFLEKLERNFQKEREYKFKFARSKKNGLNNCQEITIAKIAVQNLADFCIGKVKVFEI